MKKEVLHTKFEEAFKRVSESTKDFPPDVLLQFYALYKQATQGSSFSNSEGEHELVSAFKLNALFQVKHLSAKEAKKAYIDIAEKFLN